MRSLLGFYLPHRDGSAMASEIWDAGSVAMLRQNLRRLYAEILWVWRKLRFRFRLTHYAHRVYADDVGRIKLRYFRHTYKRNSYQKPSQWPRCFENQQSEGKSNVALLFTGVLVPAVTRQRKNVIFPNSVPDYCTILYYPTFKAFFYRTLFISASPHRNSSLAYNTSDQTLVFIEKTCPCDIQTCSTQTSFLKPVNEWMQIGLVYLFVYWQTFVTNTNAAKKLSGSLQNYIVTVQGLKSLTIKTCAFDV